MFWYVFLGTFAAFGVLCAVWTVIGVLLPPGEGSEVILQCQKGSVISALRRYCWLRELGLLRCQLIVLDAGLSRKQQAYIHQRYPYIHFYTWKTWSAEKGKECVSHATGISDPAGNDRCSGISEL